MPEIRNASCIDRSFYLQQDPVSGFEEARAVVLGKYMENELEAAVFDAASKHLHRCKCCAQFVEDLAKPDVKGQGSQVIPTAVCPSSETLDFYLFTAQKLSETERIRVEKHLKECPLCREESEWVKGWEQPESRPSPAPAASWLQYGWMAAAITFMVLATVLIWQKQITATPEDQLRALAVIKEPAQINYESLSRTSPELSSDEEVVYEKAVAAFKNQDFRSAAAGFEQVTQRAPDHSASLYLLGYCYYKLNQPEKAFSLCDRAEKIQPHSYERCMSLVNIALKTGHFGRALQEIASLYHEAPKHPEIRELYFRILSITKGHQLTM